MNLLVSVATVTENDSLSTFDYNNITNSYLLWISSLAFRVLNIASNPTELTRSTGLYSPYAQRHQRKMIMNFRRKGSRYEQLHREMTSLIDQALEFQAVFQS